jgi:Putative prokaryotic signal transducing protein
MSDHAGRLPPDPNIELVVVFQTGDQGKIVVARSLLEAEEIDYLVRGEGLQDLFGWGRLAIGFSNVVGPAEFVVRREDEQRARELLRDLQ